MLLCLVGCGGGGGEDSSNGNNPITPVIAVPDAPIIGTATAGNNQATVTFFAPASNGGSAITGYTLTSLPGNFTATGPASPLTVSGLANGMSYTFTVTAINAIGTGLASSVSNIATPVIPSIVVNGTEIQRMTDGTNTLIVVLRAKNVYLEKFDINNALQWDKPVLESPNLDRCEGVILNGFVNFICIQEDPAFPRMGAGVIWFERLNTPTGNKTVDSILINYGVARTPFADTATGMIYTYYGNASGIGFEIQIDPATGTILNWAAEQQNEQFAITVVGSDGIYVVGSIMQSAARNRIYVVKFSKDLKTRLWPAPAQYRNFADSIYLDSPNSAEMSPTGNLIVRGVIDLLGPSTRPVTLQINPATGSITVLSGPATN